MSVLVLCYHRVNSLDLDINMLAVSETNFRQQMLYLKNNYNILQFGQRWNNKEERNIVITFDDGYKDNYINAVPILKELDIPATFFISTFGIDKKREFWWDELEYILFSGTKFKPYFCLDDDIWTYTWDTSSFELRQNCYNSIHHLMKKFISVEKRNEWFDQLWKWKEQERVCRSGYESMTQEMCESISKNPLFEIGAHTINHPSLGNIDKELQKKEIVESVENLSSIIGKKIDLFSYPFGITNEDYNDITIEICKSCGIKKAAATDGRIYNDKDTDYSIPRVGIRNMNIYDFKEKIEKMFIYL